MQVPIIETIGYHTFRLLPIPGGPFRMGSPEEDHEAYPFEKPPHTVTVPGFYLSEYPVTQALWAVVALAKPEYELDPYPSGFEGEDCPVEQVSWDDIDQKFLPALQSLTGRPYRLPTEAEWEYAARGGPYREMAYAYAGGDRLRECGWYEDNSDGLTRPAGLKLPNALGLYDMSGNVWEWCADDWHDDYNNDPPLDGRVWIDNPRGGSRVLRGGSWLGAPRGCRAADRNDDWPGLRWRTGGFRLALSLQSDG